MKFKLTKTEQNAFGDITRIVARNTLSAYPDFNEEFKIHNDTRKFQLGSVIKNEVKNLLSIVENLRMPIKRIQ